MEISEVRVKLVGDPNDRLKAYCSITIDSCFVIRDLKVIDGSSGLFVAMPSRKLAARCPSCGGKNHLRARYCNDCGAQVNHGGGGGPRSNRDKLHADIAHPINTECRQFIQAQVIEAFEAEMERAQSPDYDGGRYDDDYDDSDDADEVTEVGQTSELSPYEELIQELKADSRPEPDREREPEPEPASEPAPDPVREVRKPAASIPAAQSRREPYVASDNDQFGAGIL